MTVIISSSPSMEAVGRSHWVPSQSVPTDIPKVDFAPGARYTEPLDQGGTRSTYFLTPLWDSDIDMKAYMNEHNIDPYNVCDAPYFDFDNGKYWPDRGYYDPDPLWDWAGKSDVINDGESHNDGINDFAGHHADVKEGNDWKCRLPGPEYHDDPISLYDIETPSTDTTHDGEDGSPPPGYDPQTGRRLYDYPGSQDHCECPNPWVSYDSEDPYTEYCDTYKQGVPFLTASSNRGASFQLRTSSRSETAQVCSLILLLLIVSLTLSSFYKYLESRAVAAGMPYRRAKSSKNATSKGGEEDRNPEHPVSYGFLMTFGYVFGVLLALSMTRAGDEVVLMTCVFLFVPTIFWLGMNTAAVFDVIVYERPAWAVPALDYTNTFLNAVRKRFGLGYAKICNAFLSVGWHMAFAIMLVAFTILRLADAVMKSLSGSTGSEANSNQDHHAASKKQGKGNGDVEAEASTKINPWLKRAEEARAMAESASRASEASSEESKIQPASEIDEWEMIEK